MEEEVVPGPDMHMHSHIDASSSVRQFAPDKELEGTKTKENNLLDQGGALPSRTGSAPVVAGGPFS